MNNYRGITLLSCLGKLFTSVINSRLYTYLTNKGLLGNEQVGFRPKHSTLDHIFALQILSSYYISKGKQLYCAFVDYSKAFDFIDRTYLWQKVLNSNIDGKVFNVIRNISMPMPNPIYHLITHYQNPLHMKLELDKVKTYHPFFLLST